MDKPAPADHPVHDLIRDRWSPRAFNSRPVEREMLLSLFEAARWSPSCFNEQPWRFVVASKADDPRAYDDLAGCLVEANAAWATAAPVLMLSVAKLQFDRTGQPNRHALHDLGMATMSLTLQAEAMGLRMHHMGGFNPSKARQVLAIPEDHEPVAMAALGYPGDPASLPADTRDRENAPRQRIALTDFVFTGRFGNTSPLARR